MTFHDLTDNKTTPPAAKSVFGLDMKFIQSPKYATSDLSNTLSQLQQDIHLKTYFAGKDDNTFLHCPSKLYVKTNWDPPVGDIPPEIDECIDLFCER